jgi:hypothetical protein
MIVYVAAPYSNVQDKEHLMNTIAVVCGQYMKDNPGEYTITGLVHHYACQHHSDLGTDWNFWKDFCVEFLQSGVRIPQVLPNNTLDSSVIIYESTLNNGAVV